MQLLLVAVAAFCAGLALGVLVDATRRRAADAALRSELDTERRQIMSAAVAAMRQERAESSQAALDTAISVASSKLGDQLSVGKHVIDRERASVSDQVQVLTDELHRVANLVQSLQVERAEQQGTLTKGIESAMAVTRALADTTESLRQALASPKARGQWGERMAADVLAAAGFVEGVNFARERRLEGGTVPDYTFFLPKGHLVHMDVKFPIDNYLRAIDADDPAEIGRCTRAFGNDVRQRVKELADRSYIDPATTVDYLLLFVPNESVYGFIHDNDPELIDLALAQKVVPCSPTTLFAVLAVIRQSVDAFLVERRSDEILAAVAGVRDQWQRFGDSVDKAHRGLASAQAALDELRGPRSRQFERQLDQLEAVRDRRLLHLDPARRLTDTAASAPSLDLDHQRIPR
ncbi:MAG: DNA recombination protein RmuC [Acidimicrobiales bacterium]